MKKTPPSPTVPNGPELSSDLALSSSPRIFTREELEAIAFTTPLVLVDLVLALSAQNQDLLTRTSSLEEQLAKNSRNSSKPPYALASGDGPVSVDRIAPYPGDYSPAFAFSAVLYPLVRGRPLRARFPGTACPGHGGAYHVPYQKHASDEGSFFTPVRNCRQRGSNLKGVHHPRPSVEGIKPENATMAC